MDREAAVPIVREALARAYDEGAFKTLLSNLLGDEALRDDPVQAGSYVYAPFREHIRRFQRLAKYEGPDGEEMDVLAIELANDTSLDRARTRQRNFVAAYLERKNRDAALVAFTTPGRGDWRLSFVHLEYRAEMGEDETVTTEKVLTPARRYSFLVGEGEPSHTARRRVLDLLVRPGHPTVEQIEEAFSVERVEKDFYDEYKEHYLTLKENLDGLLHQRPEVRREFARCHLTTEGFAKKLLGQIVFLYFVQKKGWLGVAPGAPWGSGPKDFLRKLYDSAYGAYSNFFDEKLEPLFYEALATERGANGYFDQFGCRIPFLNGGLFEPPGGYDWAGTPIRLKNEIFGAILDTFDTYNFTVREDEPLEKEVAVDPEMLGKVFENLLEVRDRKAKGAFYTPREIVAYMCNESLIAYLDERLNGDGAGGQRTTKRPLRNPATPQAGMFEPAPEAQMTLAATEPDVRVPREALAALVREGERWAEHDRRVIENGGQETERYPWAAPEAVRRHAQVIDEALADIKVCDPAIGSGAFPVGMMQAVVRVREVLTPYLAGGNGVAGARTTYAFKRHAIQHSLYGVDIEPSAVDIARLRLWLSLIVDEEDYASIEPLPNLRYKIVEGDALGEIQTQQSNDDSAAFAALHEKLPQYVSASSPKLKDRLQTEIDALIEQITGGRFDFGVQFLDVVQDRSGFDVVIGNPPYVRQESLSAAQKAAYKSRYTTYAGSADLYTYFIERGMTLLRPGGVFAYIVANKWMRARYGKALRAWLVSAGRRIVEIIDFGDLPVFQGATTYPCILRLEKGSRRATFRAVNVETLGYGDLATYAEAEGFPMRVASLDESGWALVDPATQALLAKLQAAGRPLGEVVNGEIYRGVVTGYNPAFVIDAATRARLITEDKTSEDLIKPFLAGRDVKRYVPPKATKYLIFTRRGVNINAYPAIKRHLSAYRRQLEPQPDDWKPTKPGDKWPGRKAGNYAWYEIQDTVAYYEEFDRAKIMFPNFEKRGGYTLDYQGTLGNDKVSIIPGDDPFLLGLLNSKLLDFQIHLTASTKQGGYFEYKPMYVAALPIIEIDESDPVQSLAKSEIEQRVRRLLALHEGTTAEVKSRRAEIARLEAEVDRLVYDLYGLTEEEIALVEARVRTAA